MQGALSLFDLVPGKVIGERFLIKGTSRQGGMSAVFRVHDESRGEAVELQLFPAGMFEAPEEARDFAASWKPWCELDNAVVARVLEVVEIGAALALVTELPGGTSLRNRLNEGLRLDAPAVVKLGLELCAGLGALHSRKLAHGDVKPKTIFVREEGGRLAPRLVDGGVTGAMWHAKHLGEHTALIGTPFYAPIEQFGGTAPDAASDVYNLATTLYELATGVLPWKGSSFLEVFQAKLAKTVPPMALRNPDVEVPRELEAAIARGLAGNPEERYPDAIHFGAALADLA